MVKAYEANCFSKYKKRVNGKVEIRVKDNGNGIPQKVLDKNGYNFKSYVNDPLDPNSIAPNGAECILEDSEGIIWIGTTGSGLERLDPSTGIFTHFVHSSNDPESIIHNDVKAIFEDHQGVLWVGTTGGLEIFDRKSQKFKHFTSDPNDPTTISNNCVKEIYEDSNNSLWFGTGEPWGGDDINIGGLNRFDRNTE